MKTFSKRFFALAFSATILSSAFAIDGLIHDSILILSAKIKDFSDVGIRENISRGKAVTTSPLDLEVGDIFIDVNGKAKKVVSITRSGNSISINAITPEVKEVFDGIQIPEQTADFSAAIEERDAFAERLDPPELEFEDPESMTRSPAVTKTMLDTVMPTSDGYTKWSFTISPKGKSLFNKGSFDDLKKMTDNAIREAKDAHDDKTVEELEGAKAMMSKRESSISSTAQVSITPQVRYKCWQNKAVYSAAYAKTGIDTHGTWKMWKWTTYYTPGYVKYDWYRDVEFGAGLNVTGAIKTNASVAIPGLSWGEGSSGPYAGFFIDFSVNGGVSVDYQYYSRSMHHSNVFSNINLAFIPSNTNADDISWEPDAHQVVVCLTGSMTLGPSAKAGLIFFGMNILELKATCGGKLSANIGGAWTKVNSETDEYNTLYNSLDVNNADAKTMKENMQGAKAKFDKLEEISGWQLMGKVSLGLYANVKLSAFKNVVSFDLLNIDRTLWSTTGNGKPSTNYSSPFANGKWDL
ncbi:hypothetical protein [Treponema sp.]|uniref:hypothetical protein n=1 Tax=Treponema sp. TaxID=166 RepID=UPI00298E1949|nr:hypothetical protein [Treponema sp.]MCQ2241491.1 hypothetical protein [Treponema sp.]